MKAGNQSSEQTVDGYIATFPPDVQAILTNIRATIRKAAPGAEEKISYGMPAFMQSGVLAYYGAFKKHIGFFPPVKDEKLRDEASIYAGEKGNLRFQYAEPIPYDLISRIVRARAQEAQRSGPRKAVRAPKL
jgi:uncharacterized protein YdhG (YjbR/CyaY superfamily)